MPQKFIMFISILLITGCLSSSPTRSEETPTIDGQELSYEILQKGDIAVAKLYLVGQGGTYDYALLYESSEEGIAMLFMIKDNQAKMVRRITISKGKNILKFTANNDWVEGSEGLKLELSVKGSSRKTIISFEGR